MRAGGILGGGVRQTLMDLEEIINGPLTLSTVRPKCFNWSPFYQHATFGTTGQLFDAGTGAPTLVSSPLEFIRFTGGGAAVTQGMAALQIPTMQRMESAATPGLNFRQNIREYKFEIPIRFSAGPGVGGSNVEIGIGMATQGLTLGGNRPAAVFFMNGTGAAPYATLTPRLRAAEAGAVTDGPSGPYGYTTDWHRYAIIYREGNPPTLSWVVDGVTIYSVTGDANMPNNTSGGVLGPYLGLNIGGAGVVVMERWRGRFTITSLSG